MVGIQRIRVNKNKAQSVYFIFHFFTREGTEKDTGPNRLSSSAQVNNCFRTASITDDDGQRMKLRESGAR